MAHVEQLMQSGSDIDASEQPSAAAATTLRVVRRLAGPVALLSVGVSIGLAAHQFSEQGRLRPPMPPVAGHVEYKFDAANVSFVEQKYTAGAPVKTYTPTNPQWPTLSAGFAVPSSGKCGPSVACTVGNVCCPGVAGGNVHDITLENGLIVTSSEGGFVCGSFGARCCQGNGGSVVCPDNGVCCFNKHGDAYCCADGNECKGDVCMAGPGQCFPGEAAVQVKGVGNTPLYRLRTGDSVLVRGANGALDYEPVLGFLHATGADETSSFLTLEHARGSLRLSPSHVVFLVDAVGAAAGDKLAADVVAGDRLLIADGAGFAGSEVHGVASGSGKRGMHAPLTASGTLVVDGAVASNYASPSALVRLPHAAMHAAFFPVRAYHALGLGKALATVWGRVGSVRDAELHPYAATLWRHAGPLAAFLASA